MKKALAILAVLVVLLLGAGELYVRSDGFSARIRPSLEGPLRELLGPEAYLGTVKANLLPPRLEARDISVPDAKGAPAVTIRRITVYLNPLPLVFKKIRLPSITILEPRIYAARAQDGSLTIMPLVERIRAGLSRTQGEPSAGFTLLLRSITVRRGEVWYADDALATRVSATGLNLNSRFNLANDRVTLNIRGSSVRAEAPAYPVLSGELKASLEYDRGRLRVKASEFSTDDASITLHGETGPFPDPALDFEGKLVSGPHTIGRFAELLRPRPKQRGPHIEATVAVKGRASEPDVSGSLRFAGLSYKTWTLRDAALAFRYLDRNLVLDGSGWRMTGKDKTLVVDRIGASLAYRDGALDIGRVEVSAGDLLVGMRGVVEPAKGYAVHLTAASSGEGKTVAFLADQRIAGDVLLEGDISGPVAAPRFAGTVSAGPVVVRGVRFDEAKGAVSFQNRKLALSSVDIRKQTSRYTLDGEIDFSRAEPHYSARARILRSDVVSIVALFYKPLPLELSARGEATFEGTVKKYSGSAHLSLDAGKAYGESFSRAAVTASLTTGKISFPQVAVYKQQGVIKGSGWISFDGNYSADVEGDSVDLAAVDWLHGLPFTGGAAFEIHSSGSFDKPVVASSLTVEELMLRRLALGRMRAEADLRDGRLKITARLPEDRARLSLLWLLQAPYAWSAEASIAMDGLDPLLLTDNTDMPDRAILSLNGKAQARGRGLDGSSVSGDAVFQKIGLTLGEYRIESEPPSRFTFDNGIVTVRSLNLSGQGTRVAVSGTAAPGAIDLALKGAAGLSLLKTVFPEVEYAAGTADLQLTVKDAWTNPAVAGSVRVRQGEFKIRDVPQKVSALNGVISFTHDRITAESLTGEVGGGTLGLSGWARFEGAALSEFSFRSTVDNVTTRYPEGLTSTVSGDLSFDGDADERTLAGDVLIRRARYDKRIEWKSMLVDIGRGLYQKKQADIGWIGDTQLNVRFHGGDNILFQNNLAQMPLDIDVFLRGTVNHPQVLGRVEARKGSVYFRKNDFKILHASADFTDPNRMNPVLDIQAETQVREYQIRLAVTGTAERAVVTLISDPALPDTDILSLLALGKKGSELKGKETSVGVGEAASFATGQFQDIFERRARTLTGLDRFQVDPYVSKNDTSVPRVTVGKELVQNKLFVTYSSNVGASIPEQVFRIEYLLNKHFSVVGERNEVGNYGADLKYRFEFR